MEDCQNDRDLSFGGTQSDQQFRQPPDGAVENQFPEANSRLLFSGRVGYWMIGSRHFIERPKRNLLPCDVYKKQPKT